MRANALSTLKSQGGGGGLVLILGAIAFLLTAGSPAPGGDEATLADMSHTSGLGRETIKPRIAEAYGKLPLSFEANQGQTHSQVKFLSRGRGYTLFLNGRGDAVLSLRKAQRKSMGPVVRMELVGANPATEIEGLDPLLGKSNYFIGNDSKQWRTNIPNYAKVRYREVYPGVDLVYYGNQRELEYDFVLAPGADPNAIKLAIVGAQGLQVDGAGDLVLTAEGEEIRFRKPFIYQEAEGVRKEISGGYVVHDDNQISFSLGDYDASESLVIDPVLTYSTYLGGSGSDNATGIAVDSFGNAYVAGGTASVDFPIAPIPTGDPSDPYQAERAGFSDIFVTKLNAAGSDLIYSTYIGSDNDGAGGVWANGLAIDSFGNAYVTGKIDQSLDFPTTANAYKPAIGDAVPGAFMTKLNADGTDLVYSTYLGESGGYGAAIAVDGSGNAYVTGSDFVPATLGAFRSSGGSFVAKLNSNLTGADSLVYSSYLGAFATANAIAVDSSGNAYVAGETSSTTLPTKNAFQATNAGDFDAFVTKLNSTGTDVVYSTYLGGTGSDSAFGIAVDSSGDAYVTGRTSSTDFPKLNPIQIAKAAGFDAFVTKLNADGNALVYSTYLGGSGGTCGVNVRPPCDDDAGAGIAVDTAGNAYVVGGTASTSFPTVNPLQAVPSGRGDGFVTKLNAAGDALVYSTYLGGNLWDYVLGVAVDSSGNAYVAGWVSGGASSIFPVTTGAVQRTYKGIGDAIVAKIGSEDNTPAGGNVTTSLTDEVTLTFDNVTESGTTSITVMDSGPAEPTGFSLGDPATYFELSTTATFTGLITVCINYSSISYAVEADLRLFHFENGEWVDQTISLDTVNKIICAAVSSLSPFAVFGPPLVVEGLFPPLAALVLEGDTPPLPNKAFKQGSTLPLKLHLSTGNIVLSHQNSAPPHIVALSRSSEAVALEAIDLDTGESNDSTLLFRFADGQWVYNLGTHGLSSGTYTITIQMPDGLRYSAAFVLR